MIRTLAFVFLVTMCSCRHKDRAENALDQAERLAEEGKYQEALEKHIWYHNHALEINEAQYGFRLSFALADWAELGKKYPPALKALRGIRDEKTSQLLTGRVAKDLFVDVRSINNYLGESQATVELFKKIGDTQPEFAASIYDVADKELIEAEEYALAKKYLGDPNTRFNTAKAIFDRGKPFGDTHRRQAYERIFTDKIVRIITVLEKTGDRNEARGIQLKALLVLESSVIRDAIKN